MSNLKYESVRIDSKTVVFIRANPGKKETTNGSGLRVNSIRDWCTFPEVVSSEKWHVTKNFEFAVTGKIILIPTADHCEQDYCKHDNELYISSVRVSSLGDT